MLQSVYILTEAFACILFLISLVLIIRQRSESIYSNNQGGQDNTKKVGYIALLLLAAMVMFTILSVAAWDVTTVHCELGTTHMNSTGNHTDYMLEWDCTEEQTIDEMASYTNVGLAFITFLVLLLYLVMIYFG